MRPWQFKQKTPGFGISKDFYLSVLAATAQLPPILRVVDPKGNLGAVEGFGVPLSRSATKDDLSHSMERGIYGVASKSRETVLRLMVIPKEEAGFDPAPFLRSPEAALLTPEHLARIGATWTLLQLTFETHEAMVYGSIRFMLSVAKRLAELTEGVVSDPLCRSYVLPEQVFHVPQLNDKVDSRDVIRVWHQPSEDGWVHTLGFQKFALPELEMFGVPPSESLTAERFLYGVAQAVLLGGVLAPGAFLGSKTSPFQVALGGLDRKHWEGIPCFELIPPTGKNACDALQAWANSN